MKKKCLSLFLVLTLVVCMALPVHTAAADDGIATEDAVTTNDTAAVGSTFPVDDAVDDGNTFIGQPTENAYGAPAADGSYRSWNAARYGDVLDYGTAIRDREANPQIMAEIDAQVQKEAQRTDVEIPKSYGAEYNSNFTYNGGTKWFLAYDKGGYYFKTFTMRSLGDKVEIWVADDIAYQAGDPRPAPIVTQEQVDKLRDEFTNNINQKDIDFFGTPDSHTGAKATLRSESRGIGEGYYLPADGKERVILLVDNIRDEQYYDPAYPFFVAGFFSSALETYMDRNIISIDTNNWETRLEDTFFGTIAHEFQHLIHSDNDSAEEKFINEGMSDFAEYLCGYGHPAGHINFFLDHPENSLVSWDEYLNAPTGPETLADYGQAYLLQLYLNDQYGKKFIQALAKDKDHGIASLNKMLAKYRTRIDFGELFRRYTTALAIDDPRLECGKYYFKSINVKVNFESAAQFAKDGVPAWGADYIAITSPERPRSLKFDGIEFLATPWKVKNNALWGNDGNEADNQAIIRADLSNVTSAALNFDTLYDTEEQWDFAMVQVSEDNGETWVSLSNGNTRSDLVPEGYPAIKENLPGFTGKVTDWTKQTFDLTPFAGKEILINFRYMTDWGTTGSGWFVKNINIPEIGYSNAGTSTEGLASIDEIKGIKVKYAVSFVNSKTWGHGRIINDVMNIRPFDISQSDTFRLRGFLNNGKNYMIVWYAAPEGQKNPVDYSYEILGRQPHHKIAKH